MKKSFLASFKRFCEGVFNWIKYMSWPKRVAWIVLFLAIYLPWEYIENQSWLGVGIERFEKQKGDYRIFDSIGGWYVISDNELYYMSFDDLYSVGAEFKVAGRRLWVKGGQDGYEIPYIYRARDAEDFGGWSAEFKIDDSVISFLDKEGKAVTFKSDEIKPWR
ncbi:MAG: hypothetical protein ACKVQS_11145 [Fimbriimonadaceae bacterium]